MAVELVVKAVEGRAYEKGFIISINKPMFWGHKVKLPIYIVIRVNDLDVVDVSHLASEQILANCNLSQVGNEVRIESGSVTASGKNRVDLSKVQKIAYEIAGAGRVLLSATLVIVDVAGLPKDVMERLEAAIVDRLNTVYSERRYYFDHDEIGKIVLSGESLVEMTGSKFWSHIKDKMDE